MDQHQIIVALKEMAMELGRTPMREEFCARHKGGMKQKIALHFGTYAVLVQAAGLDPVIITRKRKVDNSIFEVQLEKHLAQYVPRAPVLPIMDLTVVPTMGWISDIHWPFVNQRVVNAFLEYVGDVKPEIVGINGDARDMYSHAKFPRSHNVFTPREEERIAHEQNVQFWKEVKFRHPKARCYQTLGNHDVRPFKRVLEEYPEAEDWVKQKMVELFSFDGVETIHDMREELIFGNVAIHHGYRTKLGEHRDFMLMNSINGHSHVGGVVYRRIRGQTLWELNCGYAGDPEAKGLTYRPQKITNWTPGFGVINRHGPQFIPVG